MNGFLGRSRNDVIVALVLLAFALAAGAGLFGYLGYRVVAGRSRPSARAAVVAPQEPLPSPTAMPSATATATLPAIAASVPTLARFVGAPATPTPPPTATPVPPGPAPTRDAGVVPASGNKLQTPRPTATEPPEAGAAPSDEAPGELPGDTEATETPEEEVTPGAVGGARAPSSRGGASAGRLPQTGVGLALPLGGIVLAGLAAVTNLLRRQRRSTRNPPRARNGA